MCVHHGEEINWAIKQLGAEAINHTFAQVLRALARRVIRRVFRNTDFRRGSLRAGKIHERKCPYILNRLYDNVQRNGICVL